MKIALYALCNKFAKLTNDQYKNILRNPVLKNKIQEADLENDFNNSMPNFTEQEIEDNLQQLLDSNNSTIQKKLSKLDPNNKIKSFLQKYGNEPINIPLKFFTSIENNSINEIFENTYSLIVNYNKGSIKNFIEDYCFSPNASINKLFKFIDYYLLVKESNLNDPIEQNKIKIIKLTKLFTTLVNEITTQEALHNSLESNFEIAKKIRQSDIFDNIYNNFIQSPQQSVPISSTPNYNNPNNFIQSPQQSSIPSPSFPNYNDPNNSTAKTKR